MSKVVINNCVMKGQHVYEHAVNVGDTYECLPETDNSNDAKAIGVRSASNEVIGRKAECSKLTVYVALEAYF